MVEEQISINGKKTSKKDVLIIKYEGPSFKNRMELHSFIRQINSIEKLLKESIIQLNKTQKIKDKPQEPKYYLKLQEGSFETVLIISFFHPILVSTLSNLVIGYFKYLATGILSKNYEKEINNLSKNKVIRKATREIINPCVLDSDNATIINGNLNQTNITFMIEKEQRKEIKENLIKIEKEIPTKNYEQEMFGKILKIDAVRTEEHLSQSKFGFVTEENEKPIEATFEEDISEEELKKILFERIKVNAIVSYKDGERINIIIKSHDLAPLKTLDSYT
ncbi:hypothetical protein KAJ87_00945 [Candidatus Pacearchaeota archaeon]|nr:hypothetical protein [Candidatus Pacearchaeota archaeon]